MKKINSIRPRTPWGVLLISVFYMVGAVVLLISQHSIPVGLGRILASAYGLPVAADGLIVPIVIGMALLISFGLFVRTRWGYFLTVAYLLFLGIESLALMRQGVQQPYLGNAIWSWLVLLYLAWKWKYFFVQREDPPSPTVAAAKSA
jgi:hypothetical protein